MDQYDAIAGHYRGWSLTEIRNLTVRERHNWIKRAIRHAGERQQLQETLREG